MSRKNSDALGGLKRQVDNHWRVNETEYEYISRMSYGASIAKMTRQLWFPLGWRSKLDVLRKEQRRQGIKDKDVLHPSQINANEHKSRS